MREFVVTLVIVLAASVRADEESSRVGGVVFVPDPKDVAASLHSALASGKLLYVSTKTATCAVVRPEAFTFHEDGTVLIAQSLDGGPVIREPFTVHSAHSGFLVWSKSASAELFYAKTECEEERAAALERVRAYEERSAHPLQDPAEQMRVAIQHRRTIYRVPHGSHECGPPWTFRPTRSGDGNTGRLTTPGYGIPSLDVWLDDRGILVTKERLIPTSNLSSGTERWSNELVTGGFEVTDPGGKKERWLLDRAHCAD